MTSIPFTVRYAVEDVTEDNLLGKSTRFNAIDELGVTPVTLISGDRVAEINKVTKKVRIFEVRPQGQPLNLLDDQPVTGDTIIFTATDSAIPFQSGMQAVIDDTGKAMRTGVPVTVINAINIDLNNIKTLMSGLAQRISEVESRGK